MRFALERGAEQQRGGAAILAQKVRLLESELRGGQQRHMARRDGGEIGQRGVGLVAHADHHARARRQAKRGEASGEAAHLVVELAMGPAQNVVVADNGQRGLFGLNARVLGEAIAREIEPRGDGFSHGWDLAHAAFSRIGSSLFSNGERLAICDRRGRSEVIHTPYLIGPSTGKRLHLGQIAL